MTISPLAGKPAPKEMLVDLARLEQEYFERRPNLDDPEQRVSFGVIGMHTFGASAPLKELQKKFGFEPERIAAVAKEVLDLH